MDFSQDSTISKLILLYVMDKMEMPLTEQSIVSICTNNNWLNYMECIDVLNQLIDANFVYCLDTNKEQNERRYTISCEGQNCLALFYQRISIALREQIAEYIKNNRLHFKKSQEYVADYSRNGDGTYLVVLKIRSHTVNYPTFEIKITTSSRQSAIEACKKWRENAHQVYELVFENLIINDET